MAGEELDLAYRLLDLDLVDREGVRCGKLDDIELDGSPGEPTYVAAILSGPAVPPARFPRRVRGLARRLFKGRPTRVPWDQVEDFAAVVELGQTAAELGLGEGDRELARLIGGGEED
jgi:sporulation protein YlmC with PRC-barrel domain